MQRISSDNQSADIDIAMLVRSIAGSWKKLLLATLLSGVGAFVVLSTMSARFASEAQIEIVNEEPSLPKPAGALPTATAPDADTVRTQARVLQSRDLAARVAADLKLANKPEFNSALGDEGLLSAMMSLIGFGPSKNETEDQRVLGSYFKSLQVTPYKDSRVIGIEVRSSDPELAAKIANTLVQNYLDVLKSKRLDIDRDPTPGIEKEITRLEDEIRGLEGELEKTRAKLGEVRITSPTMGETTMNIQQLQELNTKLNDAKSQRSDAEARARIIREMLQRSGQVEASPDVLKSPTIQALQLQKIRIDRQLAQLSAALLPSHPLMQQYRAEQADLGRRIRDEAQKIVISLENEARIAGAREAGLKTELDKLMANRGQASESTSMVRQLEASVASKREVLVSYQKRQNDAKVRGASKVVPITAKVISHAEPSADPVFPKKGPITLLTMVATLLSGLVLTMIKTLWSGVRTGTTPPIGGLAFDGRSATRLARDPKAPAAAMRTNLNVSARTQAGRAVASAATTIATIGDHLVQRANGQPGYRSLVAAEEARIDAAGEAAELARRLVEAGKRVALVEWSIAGKSIAAMYATAREPGLRELIADAVTFDAALHNISGSTLDVIAMGNPALSVETPAEIERLHLVFEALDESYDHVLVVADEAGARRLFTLLDGGFDAGILIGKAGALPSASDDVSDFLGFSMPELEVLRLASQPGRSKLSDVRSAARQQPTH